MKKIHLESFRVVKRTDSMRNKKLGINSENPYRAITLNMGIYYAWERNQPFEFPLCVCENKVIGWKYVGDSLWPFIYVF